MSQRSKLHSNSQSDTRTHSTPKSKCKCGQCAKVLKDSEEAVECETCLKWFHLGCTGLTAGDLPTLQKIGVHWYCDSCDNPLVKIDGRVNKIEQELTSIRESFNKAVEQQQTFIDKSYASVVSKIQERSDEIQGSISKQCETIISKQVEIDKEKDEKFFRSKNLVVFGIKETDDTVETVELIKKIADEVSLPLQLSIKNVHRIGRKGDTGQTKIRPIRVLLDSEQKKWEALKRFNALRKPGVFARLDLSKEEREEDFRLRQELRQAKKEDPIGEYKIRRQKIIKVGQELSPGESQGTAH